LQRSGKQSGPHQRAAWTGVGMLLLAAVSVGAQQQAASGGLVPLREFEYGELRVEKMDDFKQLLVVERGRTMPFDSYARNLVLRFSGRRTYAGMEPAAWFARILFTPNETRKDEIFLIENPEVLTALGLDAEGRGRYTFDFVLDGVGELEQLAFEAQELPEDSLTIVDREILRLWNNIGTYVNLTRTMAFTYPDADFAVEEPSVAAALGLPGPGAYSYLDIALNQRTVQDAAASATLAHSNTGGFSAGDQTFVRLAQNLAIWRDAGQSLPLPVIPVASFGRETWLSPWQALDPSYLEGMPAEQLRGIEGELLGLRRMQIDYLEGRAKRFENAVRAFSVSISTRVGDQVVIKSPRAEVFYNAFDPFRWAQLFYLLGVLALAGWLVAPVAESGSVRTAAVGTAVAVGRSRVLLGRIALIALLIALLPHTFGIVIRIFITGRPPITNLFETFIFVGWISALGGILYARLNRNLIGPSVGLVGGLGMLLLSRKFGADGDTMPVLQAVLDTNFWLSTHVTIITIGYAACIVAGIVGRIYMVQLARWPDQERKFDGVYRNLFAALAFGLTFSFVGTLLGGVWADQSWGRFWGWDPKENGALLIVLWCALLFHAKMAKLLTRFGMAAGAALLSIVVMIAWFGINLLGVGLHSYGFIDGVLSGLGLYILAEVGFVTVTGIIYRRRRKALGEAAPPPRTGAGEHAAPAGQNGNGTGTGTHAGALPAAVGVGNDRSAGVSLT
jgi:ABC-type transport system involved in cytochrome c biogenesis permease subunit